MIGGCENNLWIIRDIYDNLLVFLSFFNNSNNNLKKIQIDISHDKINKTNKTNASKIKFEYKKLPIMYANPKFDYSNNKFIFNPFEYELQLAMNKKKYLHGYNYKTFV